MRLKFSGCRLSGKVVWQYLRDEKETEAPVGASPAVSLGWAETGLEPKMRSHPVEASACSAKQEVHKALSKHCVSPTGRSR